MFRTLSDRTTVTRHQQVLGDRAGSTRRTLIFPDVLEREGQAGVLALDDAHLAKGTFADDSQQPEVVEIDCWRQLAQRPERPRTGQRAGAAHLGR
jgi:hypothetical protein